jgi:hypothetical protein
VILAAAAGYLLGPSSKHKNTQEPLASTAADGPVQIAIPAGWHRVTGAPPIPQLHLTHGLIFEPRSARAGGEFALGLTDGSGATLLPSSVTAGLARTPVPTPIHLGSYDFYRYVGLLPKGVDRPINVYALPTSSGVVVGTCKRPATEPQSFASDCERVMGSLRLLSGRALPLGPNRVYAAAVASVLTRLAATQRAGESRLRNAKTPAAQSRAAARLSQAYASARADLAKAAPGPAERLINTQIIHSLASVASAYSSLSAAASHNDKRGFGRATKGVADASRQLRRGVSMLSALGYRLT